MSACVLLNELGGKDETQGFAEHLSISFSEFNKFNNTRARMQDSIYYMTLKSHLIRYFHIKMSILPCFMDFNACNVTR